MDIVLFSLSIRFTNGELFNSSSRFIKSDLANAGEKVDVDLVKAGALNLAANGPSTSLYL
ncbi:hypothetical protein [Mucilaginibacter sp. NFR10]|uniref:hypothetical protein n=1 Tax=Mucilaginibacter sp. NFR10 TaxID=1566292 RepID=UPI000B862157|nr:hypothetical protein [Mucilaginibacter sp. NFR10]